MNSDEYYKIRKPGDVWTYCKHGWLRGDTPCPSCPDWKQNSVFLVVSTDQGEIGLRTLLAVLRAAGVRSAR